MLSHELLQVPVHDDVDFVGTDARCAEPAHENVRRLREADVALGEPLDDFFGLAVALEVARRKKGSKRGGPSFFTRLLSKHGEHGRFHYGVLLRERVETSAAHSFGRFHDAFLFIVFVFFVLDCVLRVKISHLVE